MGGSGWRTSSVRHEGALKLTQSEAGRDEERWGRRGARRKLGGGERCSHSWLMLAPQTAAVCPRRSNTSQSVTSTRKNIWMWNTETDLSSASNYRQKIHFTAEISTIDFVQYLAIKMCKFEIYDKDGLKGLLAVRKTGLYLGKPCFWGFHTGFQVERGCRLGSWLKITCSYWKRQREGKDVQVKKTKTRHSTKTENNYSAYLKWSWDPAGVMAAQITWRTPGCPCSYPDRKVLQAGISASFITYYNN